jgi:hypothetical protein
LPGLRPVHYGCVERVEETYVRQRADWSLRVKVVLEPLMNRVVNVSPNAFARFDPELGDERIDEYQRAAISGATSALTYADAGGAVTILEVVCIPSHSTPDDVRASTLIATSLAVRKLVGR